MKSQKTKQKLLWILLVFLALALASSCSVVYQASLTGSVLDKESYNKDPQGNNGISEVFVYLYLDKDKQTKDLSAWNNGNGPLPDQPSDGKSQYFASSHTDNNGDFSFNGLIWDDLFPAYGKSGDRREVFFLFYHPDYGLISNSSPVYVISDVNNHLPPFLIHNLFQSQTIRGYVYDYSLYRHDAAGNPLDKVEQKQSALGGVSVDVYVPTNWNYSGANIVNPEFPKEPTYSLTSDADGKYEQKIIFRMKPNRNDNYGTVRVALVYRLSNYIAHPQIDSDLKEDRDLNQDEIHDDWEVYALSPVISSKETNITKMSDIDLLPANEDIWIKGRICESNHPDKGIPNIAVNLYLPTDWEYLSSGELKWQYNAQNELISPVLPANPVQVTTDNEGYWIASLTYTRHPGTNSAAQSVADKNEGKTPVIVQYSSQNYLFSDKIDPHLTAATNLFDSTHKSLDLNGDQKPDVYLFTNAIVPQQTNRLIDILSVSSQNTAILRGYVRQKNTTKGISNATVRLYIPQHWQFDANTNLVWEYNTLDEITNPALPANPVVITTDPNGYWEYSLSYPKIAGTNSSGTQVLDQNGGMIQAVISIDLKDYAFDPSVDPKLTPATNVFNATTKVLDLDGDHLADPYYLTPIIMDRTNLQLPDLYLIQSEFSEDLSGRIWKDLNANSTLDSGEGVNGLVVELFFNRSSAPLLTDTPDYTTTTSTKYVGDGSVVEKGHFDFQNLNWSQTNYNGNQSHVDCFLRVKSQTNVIVTNYAFSIYSDTLNDLEVKE